MSHDFTAAGAAALTGAVLASVLACAFFAGVPFTGADSLYLRAASHCGNVCGIKDFPFYQPVTSVIASGLRHVLGAPVSSLLRGTNIVLHALSVFLIASLLRRRGVSWQLASAGALVFGLHPLAFGGIMSAGGFAPVLSVLLFLAFFYQLGNPLIAEDNETLVVAAWSLLVLPFSSDMAVVPALLAVCLWLGRMVKRRAAPVAIYGIFGALCAVSAYFVLLCLRARQSSLLFGSQPLKAGALFARTVTGFINPFNAGPFGVDAVAGSFALFLALLFLAALCYYALRGEFSSEKAGSGMAGLLLVAGTMAGFMLLRSYGWGGGRVLLTAEFISYPLCAGLVLLLVTALHSVLAARPSGEKQLLALLLALSCICAVATIKLGGTYKKEVALWRHSMDLGGGNSAAYFEAKVLFSSGQMNELDALLPGLAADSTDNKWLNSIVLSLRGDRALYASDAKTACIFYDKALALDPGSYEALLGRGVCSDSEKNASAAAGYYSRAAAAEPALAQAYYNLGLLFERIGRYEEAEHSFTQAYNRTRDTFYLNARGEMELMLGNIGMAAAVFANSLELAPDQPQVQILLGDIYARSGKFEMTRLLAQRAIVSDSRNAAAYFVLARGYAGLKMPEQALDALKKSAVLNFRPAQEILDKAAARKLDAANAAKLILP